MHDRSRHPELHNMLQSALVSRTVPNLNEATIEGLLDFARGRLEDAIGLGKNTATYSLNANTPGVLEAAGRMAEVLREEGLLVEVRVSESERGGIDLVFDMTLAPLADEPVPAPSPENLPEAPSRSPDEIVGVLVMGAHDEDDFALKVTEHLMAEGYRARLITGCHPKSNSDITIYGYTDSPGGFALKSCLRKVFGDRVKTCPTNRYIKGTVQNLSFSIQVNQ